MRFLQALPIWPCTLHQAMNLTIGLRGVVQILTTPQQAILRLAGRTSYRAWVDGCFLGCGPARAAHGHVRVDEWPLDLAAGIHLVAVEMNATNVPAYAATGEEPFIQAEIVVDGQVVAATGASGWQVLIPGERLQRVSRMSRQRGFVEAWRLSPTSSDWRRQVAATVQTVSVEPVTGATLLPRRVPYPRFTCLAPLQVRAGGSIAIGEEGFLHPWETWMRRDSGGSFAGFPRATWEHDLSGEICRWRCTRTPLPKEAHPTRFQLPAETWRLVDLGVNRTGFLRARVRCQASTVVWLVGDELLDGNDDLDCRRLEYLAGSCWILEAGEYCLESCEPVTVRYMKIVACGSGIEVEDLGLREYVRETGLAAFASADPALDRLFACADRTFSHNAVDIFMDCPSRERAGWLCDSFFTGRVEPWLTGTVAAETVFLENFVRMPPLDELPPGMLPMCYPSDGAQVRGLPPGTISKYIPNWALWLVLEVAEYADRGGDPTLISAFETRCTALFTFLDTFRNADGLLERLPGWIFVDWSEANQHVKDVNFPTNMLYAMVLEKAGRLYRHQQWVEAADQMRHQIRRQAWDGRYFIDNARRQADGSLVCTTNHTEACQYYAFFTGLATPATHPDLWQELLTRCSLAPGVVHPDLPRAGAFPSQHLRMIVLARSGEDVRLVEEMKAGFTPMVDSTGTFWEHEHQRASCDHAFASHVAHLLIEVVVGLQIDRNQRRLVIRPPAIPLAWCRVRLPFEGSWLEVGWQREGNTTRTWIDRLPQGWSFSPA